MSGPANTQFAIAVHMATLLAALGRTPQTSELLASSAGSNPVHVRRVLGRLRDAGLVVSRPGPKGGWQLAVDPDATTLADVWRAVHGDDGILGVHEASPACTVGRRIRDALTEIDRSAVRAVTSDLAGTTLGDLARGARADEFQPAPAPTRVTAASVVEAR
jgi:DNA-binding IscR family transcriptional regulator